jgi:hypothetical protein
MRDIPPENILPINEEIRELHQKKDKTYGKSNLMQIFINSIFKTNFLNN